MEVYCSYCSSGQTRAFGCYNIIADGCCSGVATKRGSTVYIHVKLTPMVKFRLFSICTYSYWDNSKNICAS